VHEFRIGKGFVATAADESLRETENDVGEFLSPSALTDLCAMLAHRLCGAPLLSEIPSHDEAVAIHILLHGETAAIGDVAAAAYTQLHGEAAAVHILL
jgi:hypothetical protein